jgi:hypothetical protein
MNNNIQNQHCMNQRTKFQVHTWRGTRIQNPSGGEKGGSREAGQPKEAVQLSKEPPLAEEVPWRNPRMEQTEMRAMRVPIPRATRPLLPTMLGAVAVKVWATASRLVSPAPRRKGSSEARVAAMGALRGFFGERGRGLCSFSLAEVGWGGTGRGAEGQCGAVRRVFAVAQFFECK